MTWPRLQQLLATLLTAAVVVQAWGHRWMSDDGFIHLRVVQQVAGGNGPMFNVGERVEASTSPLWVFLLTLVSPITGIDLPWKAVGLGIALTAVGMFTAQAAAWTPAATATAKSTDADDRPRRPLVVPLGALVLAVLPPLWDFASSGLETGLAFAWIGASCWWCARLACGERPPSRWAGPAGAALVGLGWLIRPDLIVFSLAFGAVVVASAWDSRRRVATWLVAMLALPTAYQVFRMGYYAMLVPNTALAKEAGHAQWGQGWDYFTNLMTPHRLWLPVGVLLLILGYQVRGDLRAGSHLRAAARVAPAVAALVHGVSIVRVGGDFMHARLLLPALFGLVAPVGIVLPETWAQARTVPRRSAATAALAGAAVVALWVLATATVLPRPSVAGPSIEDERLTMQTVSALEHPVRLDRRIHVNPESVDVFLPPEEGQLGLLAIDDIAALRPARIPLRTELPVDAAAVPPGLGAGSYASPLDVYAVDPGSLAHPVGSHLDLFSGPRPGHQKTMPVVWQAAGFAVPVAVRTADGELLVSEADHVAARDAVSCGQIAGYLDAIREPLTPGRFLANLAHSVEYTFLRIPPEPQEAEAELCDG